MQEVEQEAVIYQPWPQVDPGRTEGFDRHLAGGKDHLAAGK